jgi:hypothetical protein
VKEEIPVHKPSAFLIYGGVSLTSFGVAYDSGFLGPTDDHDHSVVFSPAGVTGTSSVSAAYTITNNITGDDLAIPVPNQKPPHQT